MLIYYYIMEIQIEESKTIKNRVEELLQYCLKKENTKAILSYF